MTERERYQSYVDKRMKKEIDELIELIKKLAPPEGFYGCDDCRGACMWCGGGIKSEIYRENGTYYIFDHAPDCPWVEASQRLYTYGVEERKLREHGK